MRKPGIDWTLKRVETLKRLWAEGVNINQIVEQIGGGATPNAISGKVHRLKLPSRAKPRTPTERNLRQAPSMPKVLRPHSTERNFERG